MRTVLSVISALSIFFATWGIAAILMWIILPAPSDFIFGEAAGYFFKKLIIMVIGPGIGAYYGIIYSKKWFPEINVETISIGFLSVVITLQIIAIIFAVLMLLNGKSYASSWVNVLAGILQLATITYGALLAKRELV